eukprot:scaffold13522_cov94-Phaeocystis_antarctica.AAC.2
MSSSPATAIQTQSRKAIKEKGSPTRHNWAHWPPAGIAHRDVALTSLESRPILRCGGDMWTIWELLHLNLGKGSYSYTNFLWGPEVATDVSRSKSYTGGGFICRDGVYDFWRYRRLEGAGRVRQLPEVRGQISSQMLQEVRQRVDAEAESEAAQQALVDRLIASSTPRRGGSLLLGLVFFALCATGESARGEGSGAVSAFVIARASGCNAP